MKRFLALMLLLAIGLGFAGFVWKIRHQKVAAQPRQLPNLPKPAREFRVATLGRPAELPLHALPRMPDLQDLPLRLRPCKTPAERWMLLASGQVDAMVASSDELALMLPHYPGKFSVFPMARHQGNEQMMVAKEGAQTPPLVAYPPGAVGQALTLAMKDLQLRGVAVSSPEDALRMLKLGQVRGSSLWGNWLDQAQSAGFVSKAQSSNLEVWVSGDPAASGERVSDEDHLKVARAWLDLVSQLQAQQTLTLRAISEEGEIPVQEVTPGLRGLDFFDRGRLVKDGQQLSDALTGELRSKANLWSLAGQPVGGDLKKLQIDSDWLANILELALTNTSSSTPTPEASETAAPDVPSETPVSMPTETSTPTVELDPFRTPPTPTDDVSQSGGGPSRNGRLPGPALSHEPTPLWTSGLGSEASTAAILNSSGTQVYVGCVDGNLVCSESETGKPLWKYPVGERIRSAPACAGNSVLVAGDNGRLASLSGDTGEVRWSAQLSSDVVGPLCIKGDRVVATTLDGQLSCLAVSDGSEIWKQPAAGNLTAGVAISSDDRVVVAGLDKQVQAFQLKDGTPLWSQKLPGACRATPCLDSGLALMGCSDQNFYALQLRDGSIAWKAKLPEEVSCSAASVGRLAYVGCKDNCVYCLDRATGKVIWKYPTRERITNDLVAADDVVYACSQDMRLYALRNRGNAAELVFKFKQSSWLQTPWVQNKRIYLPASDGNLVALK